MTPSASDLLGAARLRLNTNYVAATDTSPSKEYLYAINATSKMLTVHHLGLSQSERIVWLCEELGLEYELKLYKRSPILAPPELKALHPLGTAPIITDGDVVLAESGAVVEYILAKYGKGQLQLKPDDRNYADYLFWLHFANGTLHPAVSRNMYMRAAKVPSDNALMKLSEEKWQHIAKMINDRLEGNEWLAGDVFTAAEVMNIFSLTTMRLFMSYSLEPYPNILKWLKRVGERPAYKEAMKKGDPGFSPLLGAEAPKALL